MEKSQAYEHIFIYIFTAVLVSIILIYGYNAIFNFKQRADTISFIKFRNDISSAVSGIYSEYNSLKTLDFQVPPDYNEVCIVETQNPIDPASISNSLIRDSVEPEITSNVFLVGQNTFTSFFIKEKVSVVSINGDGTSNEDLICIPVKNGKITLQMEGRGDYAFITIPA